MIGRGYKLMKKYEMKNALDTCPDGKEYLSGPRVRESFLLPTGLRRRVNAFRRATNIISKMRPVKKISTIITKLHFN